MHWQMLLFCERPSSRRSAPSGPSLSLVRCPPRFAQGTNHRSLLVLGSQIEDHGGYRSRTTQTPSLIRELERAIARRLAPYPSAASDGGQKMRRSHPKALLNRKSIQWLHNGRRIFGGPSVSEGGRSHHNSLRQGNLSGPSEREGVTPAKQKPSLLRPLRAEPSKDRRSHNTKRRAKS